MAETSKLVSLGNAKVELIEKIEHRKAETDASETPAVIHQNRRTTRKDANAAKLCDRGIIDFWGAEVLRKTKRQIRFRRKVAVREISVVGRGLPVGRRKAQRSMFDANNNQQPAMRKRNYYICTFVTVAELNHIRKHNIKQPKGQVIYQLDRTRMRNLACVPLDDCFVVSDDAPVVILKEPEVVRLSNRTSPERTILARKTFPPMYIQPQMTKKCGSSFQSRSPAMRNSHGQTLFDWRNRYNAATQTSFLPSKHKSPAVRNSHGQTLFDWRNRYNATPPGVRFADSVGNDLAVTRLITPPPLTPLASRNNGYPYPPPSPSPSSVSIDSLPFSYMTPVRTPMNQTSSSVLSSSSSTTMPHRSSDTNLQLQRQSSRYPEELLTDESEPSSPGHHSRSYMQDQNVVDYEKRQQESHAEVADHRRDHFSSSQPQFHSLPTIFEEVVTDESSAESPAFYSVSGDDDDSSIDLNFFTPPRTMVESLTARLNSRDSDLPYAAGSAVRRSNALPSHSLINQGNVQPMNNRAPARTNISNNPGTSTRLPSSLDASDGYWYFEK